MITNSVTDKRLIDLTVSELESIIDGKLAQAFPKENPVLSKDNISGYSLAEQLTGYARQTLYQLVSEEKIPFIKLPSGGVRFSERDLTDWLKSYKRKTSDEISEMAITLPLKRNLRRK